MDLRVNYIGTQTQWKEISIGDGNTCLTDATLHIMPIVSQVVVESLPNKVIYSIGEKVHSLKCRNLYLHFYF